MSLPDIFGQLKIGGFFRFGLTGDAEEVLRFGNDEEVRVFEENLDTGGKGGFGCGKAIGADGDGVSGGEGMIELGDGATVDRHGLKLEPGSDLFLFLFRPGAKHLFEKGTRLGDREGLGHSASLEEKGPDGNVWRLVRRRGTGSVLGCAFFFLGTLWPSMVGRLCGT